MLGVKNLIVVVVLVASVVQAYDVGDKCKAIAKRSPVDAKLSSEQAMWSMRRQEHRLHAYTPDFYPEEIFESWYKMLNKNCTKGTIDAMAVMNACKPAFPEALIAKPLKAFAKECLNSELIEQDVVKMGADMTHYIKPNLIDAKFVAKFRKSNPEAGPINFSNKNLDASKAVDLIADAFKRNFAETYTNAKTLVRDDPAGLRNYIDKKLFDNCIWNVKVGSKYVKDIQSVSEFWEGGLEAMMATLKPEAQLVVFRYSFCKNNNRKSKAEREALVKQVEAKLQ